VHLAAPVAVDRTYLSKLEKRASYPGLEIIARSRHCPGSGAGGAAEDINRAQIILTLRGLPDRGRCPGRILSGGRGSPPGACRDALSELCYR
jgi:hypothetical protein